MPIIPNQRKAYMLPNAILLIVVVALSLVIGIRRNLSAEFTCYISSIDGVAAPESVNVTFEGHYTDYLIKTDRFDGFIDVSPCSWLPSSDSWLPDVPRNQLDACELPITTKYRDIGTIGYFVFRNGTPEHFIRGTLAAEEDLQRFIIAYMVPIEKESGIHWSTAGYITYPSPLTIEEIQEIYKNNA